MTHLIQGYHPPSVEVFMMLRFARLIAIFASSLLPAVSFAAHRPANFDAVAVDCPAPTSNNARAAVAAAATLSHAAGDVDGRVRSAIPTEWHAQYNVPSFLWFGGESRPSVSATSAAPPGEPADVSARRHLAEHATVYGLTPSDVAGVFASGMHDTGRGAIVIKFKQRIDGIEVFRDELNVVMTRDRQLVAMSGSLAPAPIAGHLSSLSAASSFRLSPTDAIAAAFADLAPEADPLDHRALVGSLTDGGYESYELPRDHAADPVLILRPVRVKRVWFHLPDHFEAAYYLELEVASRLTTDSDMFAYVISADDGHLLFRKNLTEEADPPQVTYRVWADPGGIHRPFDGPQGYNGTPNPTGTNDGYQGPFVSQNLLMLAFGPISTGDPWLPDTGAFTFGNNADAYADLVPPDGFGAGDLRAAANSPHRFDYTYDASMQPYANSTQRMASIVQLFYNVNFFHDWYYGSGFNEAAGNAQTSNYGRGGIENDSLRAEAQDYSGRNNANMSTPADGGRPRMQMYIFDGIGFRTLSVDTPASMAGDLAIGTADFGPQTFTMSGDVVTASPADGCSALTTPVSGKIVLLDRGTCGFSVKALNAQSAGAVGVIVGNLASSASATSPTRMACAATPCTTAETNLVPSMLLPLPAADAFRAQLVAGPLHVTMRRDFAIDRDGGIDNAVVAHEWGHYLSNRLIGNGSGLLAQQSRGMGEGWSDFLAMLMMVRPEDALVPANASFGGVYAVGSHATGGGANGPTPNGGYYFAVRRVPYSTDLTRDPLTLRHVGAGVPIIGVPTAFGADGASNSEVHSTGEVWATMLWECYASLLRDTLGDHPRLTFAQAQGRMKDYMVASLRITPINPTFLDARDALLAAAFASDPVDFGEFFAAFAKRGAGIRAVAPERYSTANLGAVEDFTVGADAAVQSTTLDDSVASCNRDGVLQGGETGLLTVSIRNSGTSRLAATTGHVTSSDPHLTFDGGGALTFPPSDPGKTVTATVQAAMSASDQIVIPTITVEVTDPAMTVHPMAISTFQPRLNADEDPKQSATDDVESSQTAWTITTARVGTATPVPAWSRSTAGPHDHLWLASETFTSNDSSLVSPTLVVSRSASFILTFRHKYLFDAATDSAGKPLYLDGGVIEISTDDGVTWSDIGHAASPGYATTPIASGFGNVLAGRTAFAGLSPGASFDTPDGSPMITSSMNLGGQYASQRVRVRFRLACAGAHTGNVLIGWRIDDIRFDGISNLPFYGLTPDRGVCGVGDSTTVLRAAAMSGRSAQPLHLDATVSSSLFTPSGTVEFIENGAVIAAALLVNGTATWDAGVLPPGTHTISASFVGSTHFNPSASGAVTITLGPSTDRRRAVGK
jgi:hypothetical protein